ncbi:hypothetical protein F5888DRAFT_1674836 [Russula emetica]|nr:hypothetical protein F5888DRAFT_1674836 [Russula emetica]
MSSTAVKKAKTMARTKTKQSLSEHDATPTSSSKGHKPKLTKGEEPTHKTKSKPVRGGQGTKRATSAEETKRATRTERKLRGPWRAPSLSPSLSPTSDFEPSHSEEDKPEVPQEEDNPDEENVHLYGFSTDEDSSDDDLDVDDDVDVDVEAVLDVGTLPTIARDDASVKRKLERAKRNPVLETGVVYLSRIPHGFYEDQLRAYFSQFGEISRLRLSRNKRTGKSKHYGFIEFLSAPVAQIVSETMDNYLLMGHILTCKVIPKDDVHPELWLGANRKWRVVPTYRLAQAQHNKPRNETQRRTADKRLMKRQEARKRKLAEAGVVYNFDKVGYKKPKSTA